MSIDTLLAPVADTPAPDDPAPVLRVRGLSVTRGPATAGHRITAPTDLDLYPGRTLGIVGESGSGKTVTASAIADLLPGALDFIADEIVLAGTDLAALDRRRRRAWIRQHVGVVFQNPITALNPRLTIGAQVYEALPAALRGRKTRWARVVELLDLVGIPSAASRLDAYPHEFSGGLNQRVVIAIAIARDPAVLIADEPTTALDVSVQAKVLDLVDDLERELGIAVLLVSHDIGVIAERSDDIVVMRGGVVVERATTARLLDHPAEDYTRELLAAAPDITRPADTPVPDDTPVVLEARAVRREFRRPGLVRRGRAHVAVDSVSLTIRRGESIGLVGESGSGKTTLARTLVGLDDATGGEVLFDGTPVRHLSPGERRVWRRDVQYVFQDPYGALDPRMTVHDLIAEPIEISGTDTERAAIDETVSALLREVELDPTLAERRPGTLSGGQRQRVVIARALATNPRVLVADEPVSALDLTVQAAVIDLLRRLQAGRGLSLLLISHDLAVVKALCSRIVVLRHGTVVESGSTEDLFTNPQHVYTRELLAAVPRPSHRRDTPDPTNHRKALRGERHP
ncbi:dipeptide ABC transporter ATP-binding protein [Rhodococcus rhodochrous]|uniref:dipeptide ABC transporter ATP-binding protein n=1 Tax=Rhodococcus rhodochrous TaxID=1829 RepID=UPI001E3D5FF5|nr:dipeptide ABC transporter ATP-binding protein [Rhodococcus rhodochrous]MCD2100211.1 dipeptide ABC transporter ATP-binding protein [Rhodococcus rhodochrous]MCD2124587.1 dipeptide ABC transporter ATP-binding protein [Rhodococcus rhodochrous]MCQ4137583.1 dipeptide ABC transporter ATP-binding protein [Rhodococcus rhodochrous]MDJ0021365.1 dipeptide ABC transporter ATP-binding protein [Rhodococcus rhodochrous]